jgi:Fe-Mn family superoxide dismutase
MEPSYKPRHFDLSSLNGISDGTLEIHFKLYEGYVKETNLLNEMIAELVNAGAADAGRFTMFSELKRRLAFEFNGMLLHEYYFDNLKRDGGGEPARTSAFRNVAEESFGSYAAWRDDFIDVGRMRGVGWAITYLNAATGHLTNHWVTLHETGHVAGFKPILVMDVWEHAFLLDYKPAERALYIDSFFANVDWTAVEARMWPRAAAREAALQQALAR